MTNLVGWVRPLIEARKTAAEAATPGPWTAKQVVYWAPPDPDIWQIWAGSEVVVSHQHHEGGGIDSEANAEHIAWNDPRQIIADCTKDLALLDQHPPGSWVGDDEDRWQRCGGEEWVEYPCRTVRLVAWGYRHRDPAGHAAVAGDWQP